MNRPFSRIPLARLNLTHDPRKLAASVAGVAFAVMLMFTELGFWNALLDSTVALIGILNIDDGDLVVVSKVRYTLVSRSAFNRRRLDQIRMLDGVVAAYPLYIEARRSYWRSGQTWGGGTVGRQARIIRVLAFDPADPVFPPDSPVSRAAEELKQPDTTLIDERTRRSYGRREAGAVAELARRVVRVIGTFKLGTDFANDGNAVMTDRNFVRFFPDRRSGGASLRRVDLGLVKLAKGADAEAVAATIRRDMGTDLDVFTRQQLREREMRFWQSRTPIGTIFTIGLVMGFVVGVVICYQILATDVRNNLPEYATLKAMGYGNSALVRVVTGQALWLSCLGFLPGLALSIVFYAVLEAWTGLPLRLGTDRVSLGRVAFVWAATVLMCLVSSRFAIRKVFHVDPAGLFK